MGPHLRGCWAMPAACMTDYLSKPVDVAALFAALTRAARV
jgi:hypothetical protein